MLITGPEGFSPIQKKTALRRGTSGAGAVRQPDGQYDRFAASVRQEERPGFLEAVANLSKQVRTTNTTGKIQELRRQVSSGEYRVDAREVAARMLLMEGDE